MADTEASPLLKHEKEDGIEVKLTGCGASAACDPRRALHRYLVLIIMCFLSFGSYFCYDNPAALQDHMLKDLKINEGTFMSFYSWYSWPNVILCFFGGFLIDRLFGVRLGAIIFAAFVMAGQVVFALGALINTVWVMDLGRFIFGIGGESLCVAQNTYAVSWFKDRELNMVFGLQLSFSRVGSTVNMNVMEPLYKYTSRFFSGYTNLGFVLMIACAFCIFSFLCALAMAFFDRRASKILQKDAAKTGEVIKIGDVRHFNGSVWVLCVICVAYYVSVFPFIGLGLVFFEMKYGMEPATANAVNSLVYIISAAASPVFGFCIDKTGKNVFWVMAGVIITLACHASLAFTFINPFLPMSIMGLSYSILASALWPMVSIVVPEHQLGTAYGIMQSVQNLGLAVVAMVSGAIVDSKGYLVLEVFFSGCLCVALMASVVLYLLDAARGGELNRSARERARLVSEKALREEKEPASVVT